MPRHKCVILLFQLHPVLAKHGHNFSIYSVEHFDHCIAVKPLGCNLPVVDFSQLLKVYSLVKVVHFAHQNREMCVEVLVAQVIHRHKLYFLDLLSVLHH